MAQKKERKLVNGKIPVLVRLSEKEYKHFEELKEKSGLSGERMMRKLINGTEVKPRPSAEVLQLVREVNAIGNNINQIAWVANSSKTITAAQIDAVVKSQDELMRLVKSIL